MLAELEGAITTIQGNIDALNDALHLLSADHLKCMTVHNGLRVRLDNELRHLQRFDVELRALEGQKKNLEEILENCELEKQKQKDRIAALDKEICAYQARLHTMKATDPWILDMQECPCTLILPLIL